MDNNKRVKPWDGKLAENVSIPPGYYLDLIIKPGIPRKEVHLKAETQSEWFTPMNFEEYVEYNKKYQLNGVNVEFVFSGDTLEANEKLYATAEMMSEMIKEK